MSMSKIDVEQARIDKELNDKLDALMNGMQRASVPATKDKYEQAVDWLSSHAISNLYKGPPVGGSMFAGWPIPELMDLVPHSERAAVRAAFERKFRPMVAHSHPIIPLAQAGGGGGRSAPQQHTLEEMMAMRMRWGQGVRQPEGFAHMAMHQAGDVVHIWIITKDGKALILEDEAGLYPSDTLITKIRLLQRGETS